MDRLSDAIHSGFVQLNYEPNILLWANLRAIRREEEPQTKGPTKH
jgi:hypothetical protein